MMKKCLIATFLELFKTRTYRSQSVFKNTSFNSSKVFTLLDKSAFIPESIKHAYLLCISRNKRK